MPDARKPLKHFPAQKKQRMNITKTMKLRIFAALQITLVYSFVFNPWTSFPYTFLIIIIAAILLTVLSKVSLAELGFKTNRNFFSIVTTALLIFAVSEPILDFIIQPLINKLTHEIPDYSAFDRVKHNFPKYLKYLCFIWVSAAFGEEVLFRGFLFRQFNMLLPDFRFKTIFIIILTALLFSLPHIYLGPAGLIMTFIFGLMFGFIYIKCQYNLWVTIVLHGLVDSLFITLAYTGCLDYYEIGNKYFFGY